MHKMNKGMTSCVCGCNLMTLGMLIVPGCMFHAVDRMIKTILQST